MKHYNKILEAINRGIQFALDDFEPEEVELSKPKQETITKEDSLWQNLKLRECVVDLGLPSGTLWCKYNLGCDYELLNKHPEETEPKDWYGDYYAWGDIEPNNKDGYNWNTYRYCNGSSKALTKYCNDMYKGNNGFVDNLTQLLPEDDAAYQNMHFYNYKFHIPTKEQIDELLEYTVYEPVTRKEITSNNGEYLKGVEFTSTINKRKLFIPAAGYCSRDGYVGVGIEVAIWSSSLDIKNGSSHKPDYAWNLDFIADSMRIETDERYFGLSIRPVLK